MKLTENLSLYEFIRSQTAARKGIDNSPSSDVVINLVYLAQTLEELRELAGSRPIQITSGYRCKRLNRAIGSSDTSRHVLGLAADFRIAGLSVPEVVDIVRYSGLIYDRVISEFPDSDSGGWVHLDIRPLAEEGEMKAMLAKRVNGKTRYSVMT